MKKLQFFYDYECPFCKTGYEYFMDEIKNHPDIEIEWMPIELNPSDSPSQTSLAGQSYYAAVELGADINAFHKLMYQATAVDRKDTENADVICKILEALVDAKKLRAILESGKYAKQIAENNFLAYEKSGVWFVPAIRMDGKKLDAVGGQGISPEQLRKFFKG